MKTRKTTKSIGDNIQVVFVSETEGEEDTEVSLVDKHICWIAGKDIENFTKDFEELIKKYRI